MLICAYIWTLIFKKVLFDYKNLLICTGLLLIALVADIIYLVFATFDLLDI